MAKKNKKDKSNTSVEKVNIEFTLTLNHDEPCVKFFNVLSDEAKQEILKGTVHTALLNSHALAIVNAGNTWAELNLSPLAEES